ncbi:MULTISPECIES: TerB N-terminal domain-containing protein [Lactobacillus]|uniref:TerB N-terminal domain-containing protein n=1 Tax=Lactobacillus xujianguonis TaxID=2495899 RepID=A0A437STK9_9LACO|nr:MULTISPECIES: TerB N-terminal domain-containing protein [Lactobacillus]RVU70204.1 hypothetical protein EJK17_08935 [Lactobacillus xujianguonis]RVU76917.1 hypothetical protein EJK20_02920 [Lactobacillus xujianguonis]
MNFNDLSKYVYQKYGLKFTPAIPGSKELFVLKGPNDQSYFAMMSRINKSEAGLAGTGTIATLDLRCGDFADMIRDLPGFTSAFRLKSKEWVGVWLDHGQKDAIENALDYAYKLALNEDAPAAVNQGQYLYLSGDEEDSRYQAQAIKPRPKKLKKESTLPATLVKMRESYDYSILPAKGRAKNFYHQGQLAADYEDDFGKVTPFKRYYPTYHDMTSEQLRSYFTWRTQIRQGKYEKTSTSYAYVYLYELLNQIGVENPVAGYEKLTQFLDQYAQKYDLLMVDYLQRWLRDYVIYYHLDKQYVIAAFAKEIKTDQIYQTLLNPEQCQAEDIFAALTNLSTYLDQSLAVKKLSDKFPQILYQVWLKIMALKTKSGVSFFNKYIAKRQLLKVNLFSGAVFYAHQKADLSCEIDAERRYLGKNGQLYLSALYPVKRQRSGLNTFLHEVDRLVRSHFHLGQLKPRKLEPEFLQAIEAGIKSYLQPKVEIDFSNLAQIRADASVTRESLLTDEEKELEAAEVKTQAVAKPQEASIIEENGSTKGEDYGLTADERYFLLQLLQNKPWEEYVKAHHLMPSLLADAINDKLFDEIGDSVIEFNDQDQPQIVPDYQSDLTEIFL